MDQEWAKYQEFVLADLRRLDQTLKDMRHKIEVQDEKTWKSIQSIELKVQNLYFKILVVGLIAGSSSEFARYVINSVIR